MSDAFMSLRFTLPWAPSVNHYWHHIVIGGKFQKRRASVRISEAGERYQKEAIASMREQKVPREALKGRLAVSIVAYPPDRRVRDLDNVFKGVLDVLKMHRVIQDDGDIDELTIVRGICVSKGRLDMTVRETAGVVYTQQKLELPLPPSTDTLLKAAPF